MLYRTNMKKLINKIKQFFPSKKKNDNLRFSFPPDDLGYRERMKHIFIEFEIDDRYGEKYVSQSYYVTGSITGRTMDMQFV